MRRLAPHHAPARALADLTRAVAALDALTVSELAARYLELFGEPTRSRNRAYLQKRVAWRLQERAEGGLAPATLAKIAALGDRLPDRWAQRLAPAAPVAPPGPDRDPRLPPPGTRLERVFRGETHAVRVLDAGFSYRGESFRSLSALARRITGQSWNGFAFFGLQSGGDS